jgi:hypothetical protein
MPLADKTDESVDDITAAATTPRPKIDTAVHGHRYCITNGNVYLASPAGSSYLVAL